MMNRKATAYKLTALGAASLLVNYDLCTRFQPSFTAICFGTSHPKWGIFGRLISLPKFASASLIAKYSFKTSISCVPRFFIRVKRYFINIGTMLYVFINMAFNRFINEPEKAQMELFG